MKSSNYGAARGVLALAEILLWCGVGGGLLMALVAADAASRGFGMSGAAAAIPGIMVSVICFVGVVLTQMSKAQVDTADYTFQMLGVARTQLKVSQEALVQGKQAAQSYADLARTLNHAKPETAGNDASYSQAPATQPAALSTTATPQEWEHRGTIITKSVHGYEVAGHTFDSLETAKLHLDGLADKALVPG